MMFYIGVLDALPLLEELFCKGHSLCSVKSTPSKHLGINDSLDRGNFERMNQLGLNHETSQSLT